MIHIPIAFYLLGALATLYALALWFQVKTSGSRTGRRVRGDKQ
jgi:hypothetical protein